MLSSLSRGYGTWTGELYDPYKDDIDTESLPCIEATDTPHRHGVTVGGGSRCTTSMSVRTGKDQTLNLSPRSNGKLIIPKTFTTRKGALMLFSSQDDVETGPDSAYVSRSPSRQKSALRRKLNAWESQFTKLGTLDRLSLSVLQYGDEEEYDHENTSIADEKNKLMLKFIHSLDERDLDSRVQPGSDLSTYLRDLKYRSSSARNGGTYIPHSRETMELRALLQGLQDNKWPMSYSSVDGGLTEKTSTYTEQFTRPNSRGSTRPGSPASGTSTPRSILSARKLTASIKSLNTYRQPSTGLENESDAEQDTIHPTISAKVTRRSPTPEDRNRPGSGSLQRSRTQRLGPTSITGSIEEEPSEYSQAGGWRGSSVGTYLTGTSEADMELIADTLPTDREVEGEGYSWDHGEGHSKEEEGDGRDKTGVGLENLSEGSDGSDIEILYTANNGSVDNCRVDTVDGGGLSVVSSSLPTKHDKSTQLHQHDNSSPSSPDKSVSSDVCKLHVVVESHTLGTVLQPSEENKLSPYTKVADSSVDKLSVIDEPGDVESSITGISEDTTEPAVIKVNVHNIVTGQIHEEDMFKDLAEELEDQTEPEVKSSFGLSGDQDAEESDVVKIPTGNEADIDDTLLKGKITGEMKSPDNTKKTESPIQTKESNSGKSTPQPVATPTRHSPLQSRQSSAKRVHSGRKSPGREVKSSRNESRQSSVEDTTEKPMSSHEIEVRVKVTTGTVAKESDVVANKAVKEEADLENKRGVASSVPIEQDIVFPAKADDTEDKNGETKDLPINGAAQPLLPQYTGSVGSGEGFLIHDTVPPAPEVTPRSSRPVSRASSRPGSRHSKTDNGPPAADEPVAAAKPPKSVEPVPKKTADTTVLAVGKAEEKATPKPPEVKKGQQRRGHLPRGKKAKKDVTKAIDISSVQPDEQEKPKEEPQITVYKTLKVAAQKEETIIPDYVAEEAARREQDSKEALEKQMVEMSEILDNTMAGTVLDPEDEVGLTAEELALAQKKVQEKMMAAKEKMEGVEKPQPPKEEEKKPTKGPVKKGGKKKVEKAVVDDEKEKLKQLRKLEKAQRLEEAKALQEKIAKQQELRKAKEKEARDRSKELELEMERLEREAEEIQQAEDEVRQTLAEARRKQREDREARRKADLERKKQLAIERREQEKKILEQARNKELEMLEKIEDANVRKRQREEEDLKRAEEERLAQERLEEELLEAQKLAEEEEEKLRELERQAEEEAMQRLIEEREEATRKKRQIEEEKRRIEEEEEKKRQVILEEEMRLDEERRKRQEEENRKLEEEKKRLAELQRIENEARLQMQKELEHRREMALARRERNLEARSNMTRLKQSQGITQPWVWSYFIQWPLETYNIPIGGEPDDKKKKRPKPKARK